MKAIFIDLNQMDHCLSFAAISAREYSRGERRK
jgi:hypothetical protein